MYALNGMKIYKMLKRTYKMNEFRKMNIRYMDSLQIIRDQEYNLYDI